MSVGRGIIGDAQLYSLSQTDEMENGAVATGAAATLLVPASALSRIDLVMEIRAQTQTEDWQYARADSQAEADGLPGSAWVPVPAGRLVSFPLANGDKKIWVKQVSASDVVYWSAFGFSAKHRIPKSSALPSTNGDFDSAHE